MAVKKLPGPMTLAFKKIGSSAGQQLHAVCPVPSSWRLFGLLESLGVSFERIDACRVLYSGFSSGDKSAWQAQGLACGLVDQSATALITNPMTAGEALFTACNGCYAIGLNLGPGGPDHNNALQWGSWFRS
jgi:hypothetical protein